MGFGIKTSKKDLIQIKIFPDFCKGGIPYKGKDLSKIGVWYRVKVPSNEKWFQCLEIIFAFYSSSNDRANLMKIYKSFVDINIHRYFFQKMKMLS